LPSFKLGGSLGLSALTLGALTDGASLAAAVLASMSWPVFDGGATQAQLRAQQAALSQANVTYQATVLTALTEVEDALVALRGDQQRLLRLQNAFASADIAATLASQRYSSGLVDFQTVLETQRTRLGTQDSVASARAAVSADHVRLYKALGGGWLPSDGNATAIPASPSPRTPNS
jgi:outer membrane protein TolC